MVTSGGTERRGTRWKSVTRRDLFCLCFAKLLDNVADGNSFFSSVTMRFFQALSQLSLIVSPVHSPVPSSAMKSP